MCLQQHSTKLEGKSAFLPPNIDITLPCLSSEATFSPVDAVTSGSRFPVGKKETFSFHFLVIKARVLVVPPKISMTLPDLRPAVLLLTTSLLLRDDLDDPVTSGSMTWFEAAILLPTRDITGDGSGAALPFEEDKSL